MWLFFALIAPLLWAVVHILDAHCVDQVLAKPWMGIITSSFSALVLFLIIPFVFPFVSWTLPPLSVMAMAIAAGVLIQCSMAFYFQALSLSEAGIVAAYWNLEPALLPIASYLLLRQVLLPLQYIGIVLLIIASILFSLMNSKSRSHIESLGFMSVAALIQVAVVLLEKIVYLHCAFFMGFLLINIGIILAGLSPLLSPLGRRTFSINLIRILPVYRLFIIIEVTNVCAMAAFNFAVKLGIPALVSAIDTTLPAYIFAISALFFVIAPKYGDPNALKKLPGKILLTCMMVLGVWLIS